MKFFKIYFIISLKKTYNEVLLFCHYLIIKVFFLNVIITSVRQSYEKTGTPTHCLACEMTLSS